MKRAFTLIEVLIASFIGLLVVGAALALFAVTTRDVDQAQASYGLEQIIVSALKPLQTDLRYSTIASIATYPQDEETSSDLDRGVSMLSAEPLGESGSVDISRFGTPAWQKHVFYTTVPDQTRDGTSHLIRYELPLAEGNFELVSSHRPYDLPTTNTERVIAKQILRSGYSVKLQSGGEVELVQNPQSRTGFQVEFLQSDGSTTWVNPTRNPDPTLVTAVLVVRLEVLETSDLGKISSLPFELRVAPRN